MTTDDRLQRASAVAREYDALMGLSSVVLGIGCLLAAVTGQTAVYLAIGSALSAASASWYVKRYGRVRATSTRNTLTVVGALAVAALILLGYVLDRWQQGPIVLTLLMVAASVAVGQFLLLRRTGLTPVHWAVYAGLVIAAFGPLLGAPRGSSALAYILAVTGGALIVLGAIDHRRLVRILGPVQAEQRTGA